MKKTKLILTLIFALQLSVAHSEWKVGPRTDETTGKLVGHIVTSAATPPTKKMKGLNDGAASVLMYQCDGKRVMNILNVFIHPTVPELEGETLDDGNKKITAKIRIDNEASQVVSLLQLPKIHNLLFFDNVLEVLAELDYFASASTFKLELSLLEGDKLSFEYDVEHARKAIKKAVSGCLAIKNGA